jgi:hypothetical protein
MERFRLGDESPSLIKAEEEKTDACTPERPSAPCVSVCVIAHIDATQRVPSPSRLRHLMFCVRRAVFHAAWRQNCSIAATRTLTTKALHPLVQDVASKLAETQPGFAMSATDVHILSKPDAFYAKLLVCSASAQSLSTEYEFIEGHDSQRSPTHLHLLALHWREGARTCMSLLSPY